MHQPYIESATGLSDSGESDADQLLNDEYVNQIKELFAIERAPCIDCH